MSFIYGQKVKVGNKLGVVMDAADKYKVKFEDGSVEFVEENKLTAVVVETKLKSKPNIMVHPTASAVDPLSQPRGVRGLDEDPDDTWGDTL